MIIEENSLWANCSEAVCRIKVSRMPRNKRTELYRKLEEAVNKYLDEDGNTSISMGEIFGLKIITIDGDMPYNNFEEIEGILAPYNSMIKVESGDN